MIIYKTFIVGKRKYTLIYELYTNIYLIFIIISKSLYQIF